MSSANEVSIRLIPETVYDETPATGDFNTFRLKSEAMDGTPNAVASPEIRADRMSAGTKVLSVTSGGALNGMFVRDAANDILIALAMYSKETALVAMATDTIAIDATAKTLTFTTGDPSATFAVGDLVQLSGFADSNNNSNAVVSAVDATTITYFGGELLADTAGAGAEVATHPAYHEIGKVKKSVSIEKAYTDLTDLYVNYWGQRAEQMVIALNYAEYANLDFTMVGASYEPDIDAGDEITNSRTIVPASTNEALNSAHDVDLITIDGLALPCGTSALTITLSNGHQASNNIGKLEACDQIAGRATIAVAATIELSDYSAAWFKDKLAMTAKTIYTSISDSTGLGYAVRVQAAQLTASDPAAGGQDQQTTLELTGEAKVGANGENALRIYKLGTLA